MNKNLLILGAGAHGYLVKEIAESINVFDEIDFLDDCSDRAIGVCGDSRSFIENYNYAIVSVGNNEIRKELTTRLIDEGFNIPKLIHPTAYVSPSAVLGIGSIVCPMAVVNSKVIIGNGCILSVGALLDHDCEVGDFSHINSGAIIKASIKVRNQAKIDAGKVYATN